jgi:hypothetical protein
LSIGFFRSRRARRSKVFGIGWAKTGTTSLGQCLKILGYRHQTQDKVAMELYAQGRIKEVVDRAASHESFEDWPWLLLYREFDAAYPGSRFVLTDRDPAKWLKSYKGMLSWQGEASAAMNEVRSALYGLKFPNPTDDDLLARYARHKADVLEYFSGRDDLLIVNWEAGDGWPELCEFVGLPIPRMPFPHANRAPQARSDYRPPTAPG